MVDALREYGPIVVPVLITLAGGFEIVEIPWMDAKNSYLNGLVCVAAGRLVPTGFRAALLRHRAANVVAMAKPKPKRRAA